ncbi:MAG: universal stress protein [Myxococcales bacterium]|nr:MAG: universal stress protein [Myxococcales bacterium]
MRGGLLALAPRMGTPVSSFPPPENRSQRHRLLVCLARSESSEVCVPHAIALARTFGSQVSLLHVMQSRAEKARRKANDALGWEISRQEAQAYLGRIEKQFVEALGQPVDVRIEQGRPAERIVDVARELGADLTVLGSHGEESALAWNLGSTAQQVLALVGGSVFVAQSSTGPTAGRPRRILVPLDGSLRTESVLPSATRIASEHGAELILVHVVLEPRPTAFLSAEDQEVAQLLVVRRETGARAYLDRLQQQLVRKGGAVQVQVLRHVNEYQGLLELARTERADLVVLSAHGSACDPARSFGSVTTYLLTYAQVPLLVLQDLPVHGLARSPDGDGKPPSLRASFAPESV